MNDIDDPRRQFLINALTAGFYAVGSMGLIQPVLAMGRIPKVLVPGKSIYELSGVVKVNGKRANEKTYIDSQATVETADSSHVIFAVGKDAFVLRSNSLLKIEGKNTFITGLKLLSGKLLSVFGKRPEKQTLGIKTTTATIGIRGTGLYVEAEPELTYACTCYGVAEIAAIHDSVSKERVVTQHHDSPRYILSNETAGKNIQNAKMINHTDDELALIEALVGRTVPFSSAGGYSSPGKNKY